MLVVIAPAKTLDFSPAPSIDHASQPLFLDEAGALIQRLRELAQPQVAELMGISVALGNLNLGRCLYAKKARGMMSTHIIRNRIHDARALKKFAGGGHACDANRSSAQEWVFTRDPEAHRDAG